MDQFRFSFSDVDEDAVEELLSQILDEEVLRISTTPAGKQGPLDPELEARFAKLKASAVSNSRPRNPEKITSHRKSFSERRDFGSPPGSNSSPSEGNSSISSTTVQEGDSNSSPREKTSLRSSRRSFMASRSSRSISPPPPKSCFCGSPKKLLRSLSSRKSQKKDGSRFATKKMKDDGVEVISKDLQAELDALSDEEFLTDLSTFSLTSQQKKLKKALSEEEKVNRESEDLVKWVKQASARMDVSISDESLSDDEELRR